jgi:hypothetical protein
MSEIKDSKTESKDLKDLKIVYPLNAKKYRGCIDKVNGSWRVRRSKQRQHKSCKSFSPSSKEDAALMNAKEAAVIHLRNLNIDENEPIKNIAFARDNNYQGILTAARSSQLNNFTKWHFPMLWFDVEDFDIWDASIWLRKKGGEAKTTIKKGETQNWIGVWSVKYVNRVVEEFTKCGADMKQIQFRRVRDDQVWDGRSSNIMAICGNFKIHFFRDKSELKMISCPINVESGYNIDYNKELMPEAMKIFDNLSRKLIDQFATHVQQNYLDTKLYNHYVKILLAALTRGKELEEDKFNESLVKLGPIWQEILEKWEKDMHAKLQTFKQISEPLIPGIIFSLRCELIQKAYLMLRKSVLELLIPKKISDF